MSIFSTVAFVRNLVAGTDPWFVPGYGFGIPLPNSPWLIEIQPGDRSVRISMRRTTACGSP